MANEPTNDAGGSGAHKLEVAAELADRPTNPRRPKGEKQPKAEARDQLV